MKKPTADSNSSSVEIKLVDHHGNSSALFEILIAPKVSFVTLRGHSGGWYPWIWHPEKGNFKAFMPFIFCQRYGKCYRNLDLQIMLETLWRHVEPQINKIRL